MKFVLTLTMEGEFPGAPERDSIEISEAQYDGLWALFIAKKAFEEGWCEEPRMSELTKSRALGSIILCAQKLERKERPVKCPLKQHIEKMRKQFPRVYMKKEIKTWQEEQKP